MDRVCAVLTWKQVPDLTTLWLAHQRRLRMNVLNPMLRVLLDAMEIREEMIAGDRTGYPLPRHVQFTKIHEVLGGCPLRIPLPSLQLLQEFEQPRPQALKRRLHPMNFLHAIALIILYPRFEAPNFAPSP
ncbi:MAG TPA: hypothetical protein VNK89_01675 [Thermoflexus sp.]|nr:hypothetical protein [Thermoflexus sp.]